MGWGSGATLMEEVIAVIQKRKLSYSVRHQLYMGFIDAFEHAGWDTQDDYRGLDPAFDQALKDLHPDWYEDDQ